MRLLQQILLIGCSLATVGSAPRPAEADWVPLLDKDLSQWETYLGFRVKNGYHGEAPVDEAGKPVQPIGLNRNESRVFSVDVVQGEPVLRISGEIYGCVFTRQEYENYHLKLKVKWGELKWEPRKDKLKDSGICYHSIGNYGADYWRAWMLSQEFQIMQGHVGDYWNIGVLKVSYLSHDNLENMMEIEESDRIWNKNSPPNKRVCFVQRYLHSNYAIRH